MYRFFTILLVLTILFNVSCIRRSPFNIFNDDKEIAVNRFEVILSTLENNDTDSLKSMFSINVLKESEMMDENVDYLFSFFQGEIISWEEIGGLVVDQSFRNGNRITELKSFYSIKTNLQTYLVFILEYSEDTANPENIGLYTLRVINEKEKEMQWGFWQDMVQPGIYNPSN